MHIDELSFFVEMLLLSPSKRKSHWDFDWHYIKSVCYFEEKKKISFYYPVFPSGNIDESIFSSSVLCSVLQFSLYGPCWSKDGGDWRDFEEALKKDKGSWPDSAESCVIWHFTQLSWPHFPQVPVELNSHLVELWELGGVCVKSIQNWDKN